MRIHVICSIATVLALVAMRLLAAEVLDQQNFVDSAMADSASQFSQEVGQTFTIGVSGTLSRIEVGLARPGFTSDNAVLTVYNTTGGFPNTSLGTAQVSSALVSTRRRPLCRLT